MTPADMALKLMSASAACMNGGKCPFSAECKGTSKTCAAKEYAFAIRALMDDVATLQARIEHLESLAHDDDLYIRELERINDSYYNTISTFQKDYIPKKKVVKKQAKTKKLRRPRDPHEMDGDERFAPKSKYLPDPPVVII